MDLSTSGSITKQRERCIFRQPAACRGAAVPMVELRRSGRARGAPAPALLADVRCVPRAWLSSRVTLTLAHSLSVHPAAATTTRRRRRTATTRRLLPSGHARHAHSAARLHNAPLCLDLCARPPTPQAPGTAPKPRRKQAPADAAVDEADGLFGALALRRCVQRGFLGAKPFPPGLSCPQSTPRTRAYASLLTWTGVVKSAGGDLGTAAAELVERYAGEPAQGTAELVQFVLKARVAHRGTAVVDHISTLV